MITPYCSARGGWKRVFIFFRTFEKGLTGGFVLLLTLLNSLGACSLLLTFLRVHVCRWGTAPTPPSQASGTSSRQRQVVLIRILLGICQQAREKRKLRTTSSSNPSPSSSSSSSSKSSSSESISYSRALPVK